MTDIRHENCRALKLISRLRYKVCKHWVYTVHGSSARSGCTRVSVSSLGGAWQAYTEQWDTDVRQWRTCLAASGRTAEEALMNLEADMKSQEVLCNTR